MRYVRCERSGVVPQLVAPTLPMLPPHLPPAHPPTHPPPLPSHSAWACPWRYRYRWAGVGLWGRTSAGPPRAGGGLGVSERATWLNRGFFGRFGGSPGDTAGTLSAAPGCPWAPWGWDPAPLGRDHTVSSGMRPMSAPTATPAPQDESPQASLWPQARTPPNFVLVTHSVQFGMASPPLPYALSEGISPPRMGTYFCVRTFWPRPHVTVPNVAPGFVDTAWYAGAGGLSGHRQGRALP